MKSLASLISLSASLAVLQLGFLLPQRAEAQTIRATQETDGAIRVVAPGAFETTFTKRKGFGHTWFDLKHDPEKKRDLAPDHDENGFFWVKIGFPRGVKDGSYYANPAEEMTLLEAGPTRTRVRLRGAHMRWGNTDPKAAWKDLRFDQTWTLYPDGSAFVAYVLEHDEPVPCNHFLVITKSNGAWGPGGQGEGKGEVRVAGEKGAEKPKAPGSFTLQWSDGPTYFTDILMVAQKEKFGAHYWNGGYLDKDFRTSFDVGSYWPEKTLPAGKQRLSFLMRFAHDINSAEAAAPHAEDYRSPDRLTVTKGEVDKSDDGDRDADGYNEEEGCYVLKSAADGVAFTLHGAAVPRQYPVFKIKGWPGAAPAKINVGGKDLAIGKDYVAAQQAGVLIVQLQRVVKEDAVVTLLP